MIQPALKLLLDQGIPLDCAALFRQLGYECLHVSEIGMQRAEDEEILRLAGDRGCVVSTLDADFHTLVAVRGLSRPSVVRLRREGCRAEDVVRILPSVLALYQEELAQGYLVSVKENRVTARRLPIGGEA